MHCAQPRPDFRWLLVPYLILGLSLCTVANATPDWSAYQRLLQAHISVSEKAGIQTVLVDYEGLSRDPDLRQALAEVQRCDLSDLETETQQKAFYINAYNLFVLNMITEHWPVASIRQIGSLFRPVWSHPAGQIAGQKVSLGDLEHHILRSYNDPRIHFALACSAISCPDLSAEPYTAERLEQQLDEQVRGFLGNRSKGMSISQERVSLSPLFSWFAEDFAVTDGITRFIEGYRALPEMARREQDLMFDWTLNSLELSPSGDGEHVDNHD